MSAAERVLSEAQLERYSRHILLAEVGLEGQRKLLDSKVVVIGAGGLGSPCALYLASAGVGTIGIVDADRVDLSNLQRQILHHHDDVGRPKTESARETLQEVNPEVTVVEHPGVLSSENALEILRPYDVVVNGSDNFPTRYLVNDACVMLGKPMVDASILRFEGQATVFAPGQGCYRCLFPSPPPPGEVPSCAEAGIIGAVAGFMGSLQAVEAVKILLGVGQTLAGKLFLYDALSAETRLLRYRRNPQCPVCGDQPTISELIDYYEFCGVPRPQEGEVPKEERLGAETTVRKVKEWLDSGRQLELVDVREPWEHEQVRIPGVKLIPLKQLESRMGEIDPEKQVITVCATGARSLEAAHKLKKAGFSRVLSMKGGTFGWVNERYPSERGNSR